MRSGPMGHLTRGGVLQVLFVTKLYMARHKLNNNTVATLFYLSWFGSYTPNVPTLAHLIVFSFMMMLKNL